ncbi:MAG TPA: pyridoxal-phosphate dependent enzyme [Planctomycetes bacterium]|nr:pyridoxal-phosphate dependent enzyme [Planctomycetota bacterium]
MHRAPSAAEVAREVLVARQRLQDHVLHTPLVPCASMSDELSADIRWKLENVQHTGSFKLRGASNVLYSLTDEQRSRGVVTASSGNHGLGLAAAAHQLSVPATVFVPETTPARKQDAIRRYGATVHVHGSDCVLTEQHARGVADQEAQLYVSPYNDAIVIAGQGTVAHELLTDWPEVEVVYVALGGGGLISGMAAYAKSIAPQVEFVACSPTASPAMAECVRRGAIVDVPCGPTWSDSTAGGVEPGAITFELCRELVDRYIDVDEPAIEQAMRDALVHQHLLVEGAVGVAIAACRADTELCGRRAAIVVCGGNLPYDLVQKLVAN